jgi:spore maturation protein CgeB
MKKLAVLVAQNPYGTTKSFAKGLVDATVKRGGEASLYEVGGGEFGDVLRKWEKNPPEATLSFSDIQVAGEPLSQHSPFPHYSLLVDPAVYFMHHFLSPKSVVTCIDRADIEMLAKVGAPKIDFLPHAADGNYQPDFRHERSYSYVFFGSCIDFRELEKSWQPRFGTQNAVLLKEVSRRALFASCSIAEALFESAVPQELFIGFHHEVDLYVRGRERVELLQVFPEAHVWGDGPWKKYLPQHHIHPAIAFEETLSIMQQAKFVLNASSRFKESSHERILYALLSGAVPVTATNPYLKQSFHDGEEILLFPKGGWRQAREVTLGALEKLKQIAEAGEGAVRKAHLWEHRLDSLFFVE